MNDISNNIFFQNKTAFNDIKQNKKQIWKYGVDSKKKTLIVVHKNDSWKKKINFILKWFFGPISCNKAKIADLKTKTFSNLTETVTEVRGSSNKTTPVSDSSPKQVPPSNTAQPAWQILVNDPSSMENSLHFKPPSTEKPSFEPALPTTPLVTENKPLPQGFKAPLNTSAYIRTAVKMPMDVPAPSSSSSPKNAPEDRSFFSYLFENVPAFKGALASRGILNLDGLTPIIGSDKIESIINECLPSLKPCLEKTDLQGRTLLLMALQNNSGVPASVVKKLIEHGANIFAKDHLGCSAFTIAFPAIYSLSHVYVVAKCLELQDTQALIPQENSLEAKRLFLDSKVILKAVQARADAETVKKLMGLVKPYNDSVSDSEGYTALHHAVETENLAVIELFLKYDKLKSLQTDRLRKTALHLAVEKNNISIVKMLIANGSDYNTCDRLGNTALCLAAKLGSFEIVRYLTSLDRLEINTSNNDGKTAIDIARKMQAEAKDPTKKEAFNKIIEHLRPLQISARPGIQSGVIIKAIEEGNMESLKTLLSQVTELNETDEHGNTALMRAVMKKNMPMMQALLEAGANVNMRNKEGIGALMLAGRGGDVEIVRQLLEKNPEIVFAKKGDRTDASHQDWVYECSAEIQTMITEHVKKSPILELFAKKTQLQQGEIGNCFLLASLSALLSSAENEHAVTSLFHRLPNGDLEVRIRHPHNLLSTVRTAEQREELTKKYSYRFENEDSVFTLDPLRQYIISESELGVMSNSLAVKILERISHYIYAPRELIYTGSLGVHFLEELYTNIDFVQDFLERLMDVKVEHVTVDENYKFEDLIPLLSPTSDKSLFLGTVYGQSEHIWALKSINFDANVKEHLLTLENPHDTGKVETYWESEIMRGRTLIGIITPNKPENELVRAVKRKDADSIKKLLYTKPNLDVRDNRGKSIFELAEGVLEIENILKNHQENRVERLKTVVKYNNTCSTKRILEEGVGFKVESELLKMAIENKSTDMISILTTFVDSQGATPLMRAIIRGDLEDVKIQLRYQQNLRTRDKNGCHILHYAAVSPNPEVLKLLLKYVPDLLDSPIKGKTRWTALHLAVEREHLNAVDLFIKAGANINKKTQGKTERTPLIIATQKDNIEIARLLVEAGANLQAKNIEGKTALSFAKTDEMKALLNPSDVGPSRGGETASSGIKIEDSPPIKEVRQFTLNLDISSDISPYFRKSIGKLIRIKRSIAQRFEEKKKVVLTKKQLVDLTSILQEIFYIKITHEDESIFQSEAPQWEPGAHKTITNDPEDNHEIKIVFEIAKDLCSPDSLTYLTRGHASSLAKQIGLNPQEVGITVLIDGQKVLSTECAPLDPAVLLKQALQYGIIAGVEQALEKGAPIETALSEITRPASEFLAFNQTLDRETKEEIQNRLKAENAKRKERLNNNLFADKLLDAAKNGRTADVLAIQSGLGFTSNDRALLSWCIKNNFIDVLSILIDFLKYDLRGSSGQDLMDEALKLSSSGSIAVLINRAGFFELSETFMIQTELNESAMTVLCQELQKEILKEDETKLKEFFFPSLTTKGSHREIKSQPISLSEQIINSFFDSGYYNEIKDQIRSERLKELLEIASIRMLHKTQTLEPLVNAAQKGNLAHVQKMLKDPNISDDEIKNAIFNLEKQQLLNYRFYILEALVKAVQSEATIKEIGSYALSAKHVHLSRLLYLISKKAFLNNDQKLIDQFSKPLGYYYEDLRKSGPSPSSSSDSSFSFRSATISCGDDAVIGAYLKPHSGATQRPPQSIIMMIDLSDSMTNVIRDGTLAKSIKALANKMPDFDTLTLIGFGSEATLKFGGLKCVNLLKVAEQSFDIAIELVCRNLTTLGSTNFKKAFQTLDIASVIEGKTRILFLTDGRPDFGTGNPKELIEIARKNLGEKVPIDYVGMTPQCATGILEDLRYHTKGQGSLVRTQTQVEKAVQELSPYLSAEKTPAGKAILKDPSGEIVTTQEFYEMPIDNLEKRVIFSIPKDQFKKGLYEVTYVFDNGEEISYKIEVNLEREDSKLSLDFYDVKMQEAILSGKSLKEIKEELEKIKTQLSLLKDQDDLQMKHSLMSIISRYLAEGSEFGINTLTTYIANNANSLAPSVINVL